MPGDFQLIAESIAVRMPVPGSNLRLAGEKDPSPGQYRNRGTVFCPASEEEWQANPALEGLRSGSGDFDFFDRIEEGEAISYAVRFREAAKKTDRKTSPSG